MADEKQTKLSIIVRTVDQATAKIKAINERLDEATKPVRDFKKSLGELAEKSGLSSVAEGLHGVGDAVKETLFKLVEVGAVIGETVHLVLELCESFEALGKTSERIGVTADYLAGMRDAATRTGASVEDLDAGLETFTVNLGKARAGTGRMRAFIEKVSPALERQLEATKSVAEAVDVYAAAMTKLKDPAKRAALAAAGGFGEKLTGFLAKGPKGLQEMRDHYVGLAGSQEEAVKSATEVGESMKDLHGVMDGIKAAIVEGLAPALKIVIDRFREWFRGHREDVREWAKQLGEKIPGAVKSIVEWIGKAYDAVKSFLDKIGGIKTVVAALAALSLAPLISSVLTLGSGIAKLVISAGLVGGALALWAAPIAAAMIATFALLDMIDKMDTKHEIAIEDSANNFKKRGYKRDPKSHLPDDVFDIDANVGKSVMAPAPDQDLKSFTANVRDQARSSIEGSRSTDAHVIIDINNAPPGTRASVAPQNKADVDMNMGFQMGFAQ